MSELSLRKRNVFVSRLHITLQVESTLLVTFVPAPPGLKKLRPTLMNALFKYNWRANQLLCTLYHSMATLFLRCLWADLRCMHSRSLLVPSVVRFESIFLKRKDQRAKVSAGLPRSRLFQLETVGRSQAFFCPKSLKHQDLSVCSLWFFMGKNLMSKRINPLKINVSLGACSIMNVSY